MNSLDQGNPDENHELIRSLRGEVKLDITQVGNDYAVPKYMFENTRELSATLCNNVVNSLLFQLRAFVATETKSVSGTFDAEFYFPANWWEHLKETIAPTWFMKIWPVRYERHTTKVSHTTEATIFYPNVDVSRPAAMNESFVRLKKIQFLQEG